MRTLLSELDWHKFNQYHSAIPLLERESELVGDKINYVYKLPCPGSTTGYQVVARIIPETKEIFVMEKDASIEVSHEAFVRFGYRMMDLVRRSQYWEGQEIKTIDAPHTNRVELYLGLTLIAASSHYGTSFINYGRTYCALSEGQKLRIEQSNPEAQRADSGVAGDRSTAPGPQSVHPGAGKPAEQCCGGSDHGGDHIGVHPKDLPLDRSES